jgi:ATP-binding cassette subfamily B protein
VTTTARGPSTDQVDEPGDPRYLPPSASIDPDRSLRWWRRILPILRARKWSFIVALALSFVSLVFQVEVPNLLNQAINSTVADKGASLEGYVTVVAILGVLAGLTGFASRWLLFRTAYDFEYDLRNLIFEHLTRLSASFYDRTQSGQLISRANSDIRSVQMYATFAPLIMVQCAIGIVAFGFMLAIDVPLALIAMTTMPILLWVSIRMRKVMFPISWIIQARLAEVTTIVDENINGVRVVKSFNQETPQVRALDDASAGVAWAYTQDADLRARYTPALQNLPQVSLALVLGFGGAMVINGHLQIGAILAFNAYLLMLQAPFMMLGMLVMMSQRAAASADRIFEILDEHPAITDPPGAPELSVTAGRVRFDQVSFGYAGGPEIIHRLDLELAPGETVALVGRTGSGKSSLARLLLRLYDVTGGSITIDGTDIRSVSLESLRSAVGVVLDEPFLFSASVADNIAYGRPDASRAEVVVAAEAANAHGFISQLSDGYDTVIGERGYTLSGGQRQRIAIARALLINPPVLILDDATSAIDVHIEHQIHQALAHLLEARTTLVIAHRLSTIALADRVVLLEDGAIIATGTHEELLAREPRYAAVLAQGTEQDEEAPA